MNNIRFESSIHTEVPTAALIENYQTLICAINKGDWDLVNVVKDCLGESISSFTKVPRFLKIKPSGSSVIAMSCESGILMNGNDDIKCAAGKPVSEAMSETCCQCSQECQNKHGCNPEYGSVMLQDGFLYDTDRDNDEELLSFLTTDELCVSELYKEPT